MDQGLHEKSSSFSGVTSDGHCASSATWRAMGEAGWWGWGQGEEVGGAMRSLMGNGCHGVWVAGWWLPL